MPPRAVTSPSTRLIERGEDTVTTPAEPEPSAAPIDRLTAIKSHAHPTPKQRERDRAVLDRLLHEYDDLHEPRPDLPTWLNGATNALLALRDLENESA